MMENLGIDCLILNLNRKDLTEALAADLSEKEGVANCFVIDSGSRKSEIANGTIVGDY